MRKWPEFPVQFFLEMPSGLEKLFTALADDFLLVPGRHLLDRFFDLVGDVQDRVAAVAVGSAHRLFDDAVYELEFHEIICCQFQGGGGRDRAGGASALVYGLPGEEHAHCRGDPESPQALQARHGGVSGDDAFHLRGH